MAKERFPSLFRGNSLMPSWRDFPSLWEDLESRVGELTRNETGLTLSEDENSVYVEASLPGLKPEDIEVTFDKGVLSIKGEKEEKEEDKRKKYYRRASSTFSYRVALPTRVDESVTPDATYSNGIMKVCFPKSKEEKAKKIPIKES